MDSRAPKVSVIIPVFNGERTIARAIESVFAQCYKGEIEIVVVNDGSTDGTASVLERYAGRILVVTQENRGLANARNAGVRASSGELIAFLDADDEWLSEKLAVQVPLLMEHPDAAMVYSDAVQIDSSGNQVYDSYIPADQCRAPTLAEMLSDSWNILPSSLLQRRGTFDNIGGFCEDFRAPIFEDTWFYLLTREHGPFVYVGRPLLRYERANPVENAEKRLGSDGSQNTMFTERFTQMLGNFETIVRLARGRYGASAIGLIAVMERSRLNFLEGTGLLHMQAGHPEAAQRFYALALQYAPWNLKTHARLLWTLLPDLARRALGGALPNRWHRSLAGPPRG